MKRLFAVNNTYKITFLFLVIVSALVRLPYLDQFPPTMLQDEAASGYNAISIAKTGKDEWGHYLPLTFKSFGDYKPPVYIYLTALIYKLIGWTPSLPRIASALAGIGAVILFTLWVTEVTKSKKIGLIGGVLFSLNPWTIHLSRMALESNVGMFFFIGGMLFLDKSRHKSSALYAVISAMLITLSAYTFHSFRFIGVAYVAALFLLPFRIDRKVLLTLVLTTCLVLPGLLMGSGLTRFNQTSLIKNETIATIFDVNRNACHVLSLTTNSPITRSVCSLIWNKYTIPVQIIYQSFVRHISPNFLFFYGDETFNRNPVKTGELFVFLFPFFLYGLLQASRIRKFNYIVAGFFITMIPAILTGPPHSTRLSAQIPFVIFLVTLGLDAVSKKIRYITPICITLVILSTGLFVLKYAFITNANSQEFLGHSRAISEGAYEYWNQGYTVYIDQDVLSESHIFFAYWNNFDPKVYASLSKKIITDQFGFTRPIQLGDRLFFESGEVLKNICASNPIPKTIFITNKDLPYPPEKSLVSFSGVYKLASFYDIDKINKTYCNKDDTNK